MDLTALTGTATEEGLAVAVIIAVFLAGLRHGFDIDHIAAITDITSSQRTRKGSYVLATSYALGHLIVLVSLGTLAVFTGRSLSGAFDALAGRIIGGTLVALGVYVAYSLIRFRRMARLTSRWMLVIAGVRRVLRGIGPPRRVVIEHEHEHPSGGHHEHDHGYDGAPDTQGGSRSALAIRTRTHSHRHRHVVPMPPDPFVEYGVRTTFAVGMLHGVGAETPTQLLLFTSAAGAVGEWGGLVLVAAFALGLLLGNSILAVATTAGFTAGGRFPIVYMAFAGSTAMVSIYVGAAYLMDRPDLLPAFLGG